MLNLGEFPTQPKWSKILRIPISQARPFALKTSQTHSSFPSNRPTRFNLSSIQLKSGTGFRSYASKTQGKGESENFVVDMEEFDGADGFEEDEDDDDDDDVFVPLKNMKEWLQNKPRGFGEGKVYDTSTEDALMEEIEQSRKAQLANINNLKNKNSGSMKKQLPQGEASKEVQDGFRVRLFNLPKKKNILKDLQLAFKGFPGVVNIKPVVSGNNKTRDPICKGIAFVEFKSEDGAQRFVQTFSGQSIYFGKVEKPIKCEMMSSSSTKPKNVHSVDETSYDPSEPNPDGVSEADLEIDPHTLDSSEENDAEMEHLSAQMDDSEENMETESGNEQDIATKGSSTDSTIQKKIVANEKKKKAKRKNEKTSKLNIPGSARRLKTREKALLTGVLSKYGLNTALREKEQISPLLDKMR